MARFLTSLFSAGPRRPLNLAQAAVAAIVLGTTAAVVCVRLLRPRVDWREQRVVVMGGSRGLGLLLAREFLTRGARVVVTARDGTELERAVAALQPFSKSPDGVSWVLCDVAKADDVRQAIELSRAQLGGVDVLVNNAGLIQVGPLEAMRFEDFEQALRVHLHGPLTATLAVVDEMRARRSGRIINISSIGGLVPIPHLMPYVASKFALTGLSQALHIELAKDGVVVTTVCPGLMRTGSSHRAEFKSQHRKEHAWFALGDATPLTSMNAHSAARKIVNAAERGRIFVVLSWQAKVLATAHALAPRSVIRLLTLVNGLLPRFGGIGTGVRQGLESASPLAPSLLTRLNDKAAVELGELGPPRLKS